MTTVLSARAMPYPEENFLFHIPILRLLHYSVFPIPWRSQALHDHLFLAL